MITTTPSSKAAAAFTLLEVMLALGLFFLAVFTILGVISGGLRNARSLQRKNVDGGMVAAMVYTNDAIVEDLENGDFGKMYPDYTWTTDAREVSSNKLFQVDIIVQRSYAKGAPEAMMSVLVWSPKSKPGTLDGGLSP